jgi:hypothetical protein
MREAMMTKSVVAKMHSTDFPWVSDDDLMRYLTEAPQRPNLLVRCSPRAGATIVGLLQAMCAAPVVAVELPGPLMLPTRRAGTLVLQGASAMTLPQQIELHDWLSVGPGSVQVVTITSEPLWDLVQQGRFLEGLFYRLNVVYLEAENRR